jgi:hypothetical protein
MICTPRYTVLVLSQQEMWYIWENVVHGVLGEVSMSEDTRKTQLQMRGQY